MTQHTAKKRSIDTCDGHGGAIGQGTAMPLRQISFGHTPDADDAFMWFALTAGKSTAPGVEFKHLLKSMHDLNLEARRGVHEVSAISFGAYPEVAETYSILSCGGCFGVGHGPVVIAAQELNREQLLKSSVAIPGRSTTAAIVLQLYARGVKVIEMPFDRIMNAVEDGEVAAGLIISEAQMTYGERGLCRVADLAQWWCEQTALPLPLGGNVIRKDVGPEPAHNIAAAMRNSIVYCLEHRREALRYAMQWARGLSEEQADKFVGRYVSELTVDFGETGKKAIMALYERAFEAGIVSKRMTPEFVKA